MAPQNEQQQEGGLYRPIPVRRLGPRDRAHKNMVARVTRDSGLTRSSDDDGVAALDVCAFQSSV